MANLNTRLREQDRDETINALNRVLDNSVKFWQMPVRDRYKWIRLYNSKFPPEIFDAIDVCKAWGYTPSTYGVVNVRFVIEHEYKYYSANIDLDELPVSAGRPPRQPIRWTNQIRQNKKICVDVRTPITNDTSSVTPAMWLSLPEMHEYLGVEHTEHFMEWMISTAQMRLELKEAVGTIAEIMKMAKTAGQVKRMVPDLLQYLPPKLQLAYQDQVRASSLPFEWSNYDKDRVDRLLIALGKGHLLAGMAKDGQKDWTAANIENWVWGAEVTVAHVRQDNDDVIDDEQDD